MSWMNIASEFGGGLLDFAKSNPKLVGGLAGAGLGYATGGTKGALLGGVGGASLGYGAEQGLFGQGIQDSVANAGEGMFSGLFGQAKPATPNLYQGNNMLPTGGFSSGTNSILDRASKASTGLAMPAGYGEVARTALPQVTSTPATSFGGISDFYDRNKGLFEGAKDISKLYGDISGGMTQRDLAESEIDYRNRIASLNEAQFNRQQANMATTQAGVDEAFRKSKLRNYYTV